ncbi:MAG TPA: HEAT repeat domain-containing protein [Planctomycetota bacterium]|nr:HEAT repeat domain-containing protein [Planctomycetota bacterium]
MSPRAPRSSPRSAWLVLVLALAAPAAVAQSGGTAGGAGGAGGAAAPAADEAAEAAGMSVVATIDDAVDQHDPVKIKPVFETLDTTWPRLSQKTIKRVEKSIGAMFAKLKPRESRDVDTLGDDARNGRFKPEDEPDGKSDNQKADVLDCYHSAIGLLYDKPDGPSVLLPVLKLPHVKTWPEVQVLVLEGLGYREDPALAKEFEAYLRHESTLVACAAAEALGHLRDQPQDVRRRAAGAVVDAFCAAEKASEKEAGKVGEDDEHPARRYLSSITVSFREALTALTQQTLAKPSEWRAWFDAHGKDASW